MSEETKSKKGEVSSQEELYKDWSDEQLQKVLISFVTSDTGEQNPIAYDIADEIERRIGSGSKDKED